MRTISKGRGYFHGSHKGHEIEIEREADPEMREQGRRFYIRVWNVKNGLHGYDGWSREDVVTMAEAKREALYGACLKERPSTDPTNGGDA